MVCLKNKLTVQEYDLPDETLTVKTDYRGVLSFPTLNFPTVLIFPTILEVLIFLAPMLNFPTIFEFGQNIQKFFEKFSKFV